MQLLRLKEVLKEKKVTGKELAGSVGVNPVSISNIVQNKVFPKPQLLRRIAVVLDVDIRELFLPSKGENRLNGYVEFNNVVYKIKSIKDLRLVMSMAEGKDS